MTNINDPEVQADLRARAAAGERGAQVLLEALADPNTIYLGGSEPSPVEQRDPLDLLDEFTVECVEQEYNLSWVQHEGGCHAEVERWRRTPTLAEAVRAAFRHRCEREA